MTHLGRILKQKQMASAVIAAAFVSLFFVGFISGGLPQLAAQTESLSYREAVTVPVDKSVLKKLATAENLLIAKNWEPALELLDEVKRKQADVLVAAAPGRYVNAVDFVNGLLASLPAEGLKVYRRQIDPALEPRFRAALKKRSREEMRQLASDGFASSWGDDALYWLGEWAFAAGEIDLARSYWKELIPLRPTASDRLRYTTPRYPDSDYPQAEILARLILCSLAESNLERARIELHALTQQFPDATGNLAGRDGPLVETVASLIGEQDTWDIRSPTDSSETFAGTPQRAGSAIRRDDGQTSEAIGILQWKRPLIGPRIRTDIRQMTFYEKPLFCYHPVAWHESLFLVDDDRVFAWQQNNGQPTWGDSESDEGRFGVIYPAFAGLEPPLPSRPAIGVPNYTLSIVGGKLYARLGSPISLLHDEEMRALDCKLVCLDVESQQGRLIWKSEARQTVGNWRYSGAPLVVEDRLYVALQRNYPQTEFGVACLNAETGQLIWTRIVASALANIAGSFHFISHDLLTYGGQAIYHTSESGSITAIDPHSGRIRWLITYPSQQLGSMADANDPLKHELSPCMYQSGLLIAAPNDQSLLLGIDADSGVRLWERKIPGGVQHLLGVSNEVAVVSGERLTGVHLSSGRPIWQIGASDPESFGWGRGTLAGDKIYWPRRDEILVVDPPTGKLTRRIPVWQRYRKTGGNLLTAGGRLFVTLEDQLYSLGSSQPELLNLPATEAAAGHYTFPNN